MFFAIVMLMADLANHLERFFIGFRAGVRVVDAIKTRHFIDQHFCERGAWNGPHRTTKETHFCHSIRDGITNSLAAIAHVDCPDAARHCIDVFFPFDVPNSQAFAFNYDARVDTVCIGLVLTKMMPHVGAVGLNDAFGVVGQ